MEGRDDANHPAGAQIGLKPGGVEADQFHKLISLFIKWVYPAKGKFISHDEF